MSTDSLPQLLSSGPSDFVSYDIPLDSGLPDKMCNDLPSVGTTVLNSAIDRGETGNHENYDFHSHGFFFGSQSTKDLSLWSANGYESVEDEDDMEDEGISEIYANSNDPNMWTRESNRSFKPNSDVTQRRAISKKIANVGIIGQNIGLGHRFGVLSEDATLIPKSVLIQSTRFIITEDSPVQNDVTWSRPDNASTFTTLIYSVEASLPHNGGEWTEVASVRQTVFRFYHTDDKMFIGKHQLMRRDDDIAIKLRVRCHGELTLPDRVQHWLVGPYSKTVEVIFVGNVPTEVLQTVL